MHNLELLKLKNPRPPIPKKKKRGFQTVSSEKEKGAK